MSKLGAQDLGMTAGDRIEHLRLDADMANNTKLLFTDYRKHTVVDGNDAGTDVTFADDAKWFSARTRIQRVTDNTHQGYIDFGSHDVATAAGDSATTTGGPLFCFGVGAEWSASNDARKFPTASGLPVSNNQDRRFFCIQSDENQDDFGKIGVNTAYPEATQEIVDNSEAKLTIRSTGSSDSVLQLVNGNSVGNNGWTIRLDRSESEDLDFRHNNSQKFTIQSTGEVGIGTRAPSQKLHVVGQILATQDITAFSDKSLKDNIETIPNALEKVTQLRGVSYTRKDTGKAGIGVIAQEIEKIIPEVVSDNDGTKSVAYGNVVGLLIEAIKELQNEIEELKRDGR